jgi:nucleotidyltransferase/DNA polymerase involved in DNA repair
METTATILHADLDAFYASVEQLLDPSLRSKPIAVGGGVVLAASYEAKSFGVSSGMSGRRARELCPQLIFVGGHFQDYQRLGDAAIDVLNAFTPLVERISIDEAFADVAGCTHLFGSAPEIARAVRRRVRAELGLPISIGVARTKHLAKIASQVAKPDKLLPCAPSYLARNTQTSNATSAKTSRTVTPASIDTQQSSRRIASLTPLRMTYVSLPSNSTVHSGSVICVTALLLIAPPPWVKRKL